MVAVVNLVMMEMIDTEGFGFCMVGVCDNASMTQAPVF